LSLDLSDFDSWKFRLGGVDLTEDHLNVYDQGINLSWNTLESEQVFESGSVLFYIDVQHSGQPIALEDIRLNQAFDSELYTPELKKRPVGLQYHQDDVA